MSLFKNPVWKDGPTLCGATNLPAFETEKDAREFMKNNTPRASIDLIYRCHSCGHIHVQAHGPDPAGDSSGTGRSAK